MPIKDCPFTPITPGRSHDLGPMLWIRVTNPATGQAAIFKALVNTGTYSCIFPANVAPYLGHKLKSVKPVTIEDVGGFANTYPHTSRVEILDNASQRITRQNGAIYH